MTRGETSRMRLYQAGQLVLDERRSPNEDYVESFYQFERIGADTMPDQGCIEQTSLEN